MPSLFVKAEPVIYELGHAGIHDAVVDVRPVPTLGEDAQNHEPPKLSGNSLGFHTHSFCQVAHAWVIHEDERMQQAEASFRS
jgi:hypothetical protein